MGCLFRTVFTAIIMVIGLAGIGQDVSANGDNAVIGMRLGNIKIDSQPATRLVIETQDPVAARMSLLTDPYRLVVDMPETTWQVDGLPDAGGLSNNPVHAYRFGVPQAGTGRLVFEMNAPAVPARAFALPPNGGGYRLVIDMTESGKTAFLVAAGALRNSGSTVFGGAAKDDDTASAQTAKTPTVRVIRQTMSAMPSGLEKNERYVDIKIPVSRPHRWIVFIDAGHGGKDPGAIGRAGTKEKHITLAAALELASQLQATGQIQAKLARTDDRYLKLRQRISLAREHNADLFISLHADSADSKSAHGISVFTLSETASDKEAAALARNENKADLIGGPDLGAEDPDAANELLRMFQRESMNQSTHFASAILRQIRDLPGGDRRGHRFAGFAVLKAPDMPSVLVEMGFLSNRKDEANLNKKAYRRELVTRLRRAILAYLHENGPRQG